MLTFGWFCLLWFILFISISIFIGFKIDSDLAISTFVISFLVSVVALMWCIFSYDLTRIELQNAKVVEISDKMDGSMQSCRYYNGDYFMCGSMALDASNSWRLADGKSMLTDNHKNMIKTNDNFTFVFEYISLKDSHVICYNKEDEGLYLIGVIDIRNGS